MSASVSPPSKSSFFFVKGICIAVGIVAAGFLSTLFVTPVSTLPFLWLPAGISFAAFLLWDYRKVAPYVFLGSFSIAASAIFYPQIQESPLPYILLSLLFALFDCVQGFLGSLLCRPLTKAIRNEQAFYDDSSIVLCFFRAATIAPVVGILISLFAYHFLRFAPMENSFFYAIKWYIADVFAMALCGPIGVLLFSSTFIRNTKNKAVISVVYSSCLFICVSAFFWFQKSKQTEVAREYSFKAEKFSASVELSLKHSASVFNSLSSFHYSSNYIDRDEFGRYTDLIKKSYPNVVSFAWIPRVPKSSVKQYEAEARKFGASQFRIRTDRSAGKSNQTEAYYPLYYFSGPKAQVNFLGDDLATDPNRWETMQKTCIKNTVVATKPIQIAEGKLGLAAYFPIFKNEIFKSNNILPISDLKPCLESIAGFYGATFSVEEIVNAIMREHFDDKSYLEAAIQTHILDVTDKNKTLNFFSHQEEIKKHRSYLTNTTHIDIFHRKLAVHRSIDKAIAFASIEKPVWFMFSFGLFLSAVFGMFTLLTLIRRRNLEEAVDKARKEAISERSQKEASARLASLGEMAAGIAHEINNPLTIIQGYTFPISDMAESGNFDAEVIHENIEKMKKTIKRIASIIEGLCKFSRDNTNDPFVKSDLVKIIRETLEFSREAMKNRDITVEVINKSKNAEVFAECRSLQISQILINLLNNAKMAIEKLEGDRWIRIEITEAETTAQIRVTDSGGGIPKEKQDSIFKPFFTTKVSGEGTGLGLSITQTLVTSHNGRVWLDTSDSNTSFIIELPKIYQEGSSQKHAA